MTGEDTNSDMVALDTDVKASDTNGNEAASPFFSKPFGLVCQDTN